jgi:hypothetical protein
MGDNSVIILTGKTKEFGKKTFPLPFCPRQILHAPNRARTQASAVRGRRLTAWAMALPKLVHYFVGKNTFTWRVINVTCFHCKVWCSERATWGIHSSAVCTIEEKGTRDQGQGWRVAHSREQVSDACTDSNGHPAYLHQEGCIIALTMKVLWLQPPTGHFRNWYYPSMNDFHPSIVLRL